MRIILAVILLALASLFAMLGSEKISLLPDHNKYAEIMQGPTRWLNALSIAAAFAAGLVL